MKKYRITDRDNAEAKFMRETEEMFGFKFPRIPKKSEHGEIVDFRFEAYCNVTVYEDGYVSRDYIGD